MKLKIKDIEFDYVKRGNEICIPIDQITKHCEFDVKPKRVWFSHAHDVWCVDGVSNGGYTEFVGVINHAKNVGVDLAFAESGVVFFRSGDKIDFNSSCLEVKGIQESLCANGKLLFHAPIKRVLEVLGWLLS